MLCVWLVDDDAYCREHLTWRLNAEPNVDCARCFSSASFLLAALRQEPAPDVILLGAQLAEMNGMEVIRPIKNLAPSAILLMLSTFFDQHLKEQSLAAGASDFLLKRDAPAQIIAAIRATAAQFSSPYRTHVLAS